MVRFGFSLHFWVRPLTPQMENRNVTSQSGPVTSPKNRDPFSTRDAWLAISNHEVLFTQVTKAKNMNYLRTQSFIQK